MCTEIFISRARTMTMRASAATAREPGKASIWQWWAMMGRDVRGGRGASSGSTSR
jgi:hypothetical protein